MGSFLVHGIIWETDGEAPDLPNEVVVECEDCDDIADALSDAHGWLMSDFDFEVLDASQVG